MSKGRSGRSGGVAQDRARRRPLTAARQAAARAAAPARPRTKVGPASCAVRKAGPDDLNAIDAIEQAAFTVDRFARRNLARLLAARSAEALLAESRGEALGYALLLFRRGARLARLYSIAVGPPARGKGVASALMQAVDACAINRGCDRLRLEVRAGNAPAIRLYERHGFALLKRLPGYYRDGAPALQMQKRLRDAKSDNT